MPRQPAALPLVQDNGQPSGRPSKSTTAKRLTLRDQEIITALIHQVRCFDVTLVSRQWWNESIKGKRAAKRRLSALISDGWLKSICAFARPPIMLERPIVTWKPGNAFPDYGPISYYLKTRFRGPAKVTSIFVATKQSLRLFGGLGIRVPRSSEVTHDLGLASVYLTKKSNGTLGDSKWVSESKLVSGGTEKGVKVPDAILVTQDEVITAIEFGGEYSKRKLIAFHSHCDSNQMGYELW